MNRFVHAIKLTWTWGSGQRLRWDDDGLNQMMLRNWQITWLIRAHFNHFRSDSCHSEFVCVGVRTVNSNDCHFIASFRWIDCKANKLSILCWRAYLCGAVLLNCWECSSSILIPFSIDRSLSYIVGLRFTWFALFIFSNGIQLFFSGSTPFFTFASIAAPSTNKIYFSIIRFFLFFLFLCVSIGFVCIRHICCSREAIILFTFAELKKGGLMFISIYLVQLQIDISSKYPI